MKTYRLKPEAVKFFKEKHATSIYSLEAWEKIGVDIKALEEIREPFINFGHESLNFNASSLSGWSKEGSHFHFTIHFPDTKMREHDKFSKGKVVRKLMDDFQSKINYFFQEYANGQLEEED
jgi:hypothetical protein